MKKLMTICAGALLLSSISIFAAEKSVTATQGNRA